jgi:hypothetical protein
MPTELESVEEQELEQKFGRACQPKLKRRVRHVVLCPTGALMMSNQVARLLLEPTRLHCRVVMVPPEIPPVHLVARIPLRL